MTLPNSYSKVNRKVYTFFQETENNKSQISIQKNEQNIIKSELNKSKSDKMSLSIITDLSFDWSDFQTLSYEENTTTGIVTSLEIFQVWEITIYGLLFSQLPSLKHNFLIRFGTGEPLLDFEIAEDTTVWSTKTILSKDIEDTTSNEHTFYYGLYMSDVSGLEELDDNGVQCKLQLTLTNPNYIR